MYDASADTSHPPFLQTAWAEFCHWPGNILVFLNTRFLLGENSARTLGELHCLSCSLFVFFKGRSSLCGFAYSHVTVGEIVYWSNPSQPRSGMPSKEGGGQFFERWRISKNLNKNLLFEMRTRFGSHWHRFCIWRFCPSYNLFHLILLYSVAHSVRLCLSVTAPHSWRMRAG